MQAAKDALAQLEPPVDEIVVSTHAPSSSGWMRRNVVERHRARAGGVPVEHVIASDGGRRDERPRGRERDRPLGGAARPHPRRAQRGPGELPDRRAAERPEGDDEPEADRRLRRALTELRGEGIDAHGQIVHPDPYTAAMQATHDERVDEIIVSTFPGERTGWLRRDLVERLRKKTGLPVEHVVSTRDAVDAAA